MKNYVDTEDSIRGWHCRRPGVYKHVPGFLIIKPTRCTNFSNLFWKESLHVSECFLSIIRSFSLYTQQGIFHRSLLTACKQDRDGTSWSCFRMEHPDPASGWNILILLQDGTSWFCFRMERTDRACRLLWHISLLCAQWKTPDDGQRNCPKHVEFPSKTNLRNWPI